MYFSCNYTIFDFSESFTLRVATPEFINVDVNVYTDRHVCCILNICMYISFGQLSFSIFPQLMTKNTINTATQFYYKYL